MRPHAYVCRERERERHAVTDVTDWNNMKWVCTRIKVKQQRWVEAADGGMNDYYYYDYYGYGWISCCNAHAANQPTRQWTKVFKGDDASARIETANPVRQPNTLPISFCGFWGLFIFLPHHRCSMHCYTTQTSMLAVSCVFIWSYNFAIGRA